MKINVYYEDKNHPIELDVPDAQCEIWVEDDYQRRLSSAEDKTSVTRRTAQEIMDEDYNNPTFNSNQKETRRHVHLDALDPEDKHMSDGTDILADLIKKEGYERLYAAIRKLQPQQRELLYRVYWNGEKQKDISSTGGIAYERHHELRKPGERDHSPGCAGLPHGAEESQGKSQEQDGSCGQG